MFSKKLWLSLMVLASLFSGLIGCSNYLKGEKNQEEVIDIPNQRLEKLKTLPENIKKVSVGELSAVDIRESFDTIQYALQYFAKRTRGSGENSYSVEDMRKFFGKYFLKENNVSPELAQEMMKLKKALLGGSEKWITKEEIIRLVDLIGILKEETVLLTPYFKILLLKQEEKLDWQQVTTAMEQLRTSLQKLLKSSELPKSDYSFQDGKKLLTGLADFITGDRIFAAYQNIGSWGPLIESVKIVLIGQKARFAGQGDWSLALDNFVDLYEVFLKYHYLVSKQDFGTSQEIRQVSQFFGQTMKLIATSYQMQKTGEIPFSALDSLLDQATEKKLIPLGLTANTLKKVYRTVLMKIFDTKRGTDTRGFDALKRHHLVSILREFNVWRLSQSFVDQLPFSPAGFSAAEIVGRYEKFDFDYVIRGGLERDPYEQDALRKAWKDFGELLKLPVPMVFDNSGRILIRPGGQAPNMTWKSLMRFNLMKTVTRLFLIGYGDHGPLEISQARMQEKDLSEWYTDFQEAGQELQAFDPRSPNPGKRSFMEANFFTFHGNGDDHMTSVETFEFVSFLFSAGLGSGTQIQADLRMAHCEVAEIDVMGYAKFDQACFKDTLHRQFAQEFANMPNLVSEVQKMSPAQWDVYFANVLGATRVSDPKLGRMEMADLRTMVVVIHYIESLMKTYDKDGSQSFSLQEIYDSFPRFASFLRQTNKGVSDDNLKDGFAYMLFFGAKPSNADMVKFWVSKNFYDYQATRGQIVKVFQVLKEDLNKAKK